MGNVPDDVGTTAVAVCLLLRGGSSASLSLSLSLQSFGNPSERATISDSSASPCCGISLLAENLEVARFGCLLNSLRSWSMKPSSCMVRVNDGIPIQTIVQDHAWFVATGNR